MKTETQCSKIMEHSKCSSKREVYNITGLPHETRKLSDKQLTLQLKKLEKEEKIKHKVS